MTKRKMSRPVPAEGEVQTGLPTEDVSEAVSGGQIIPLSPP